MKKIVIAVTGGIAAYKAADVISALISKGYEVKVIATDNALNFVTSNVLNVISKGNYITEMPSETKHIDLAKWCDAFVIVPATANTISKISNGMADNFVTTTYLALHPETKKFICPAMNTYMWDNPITKSNLSKLTDVRIIEPVSGLLACGDIGMGKLAPTKTIVDTICDDLENFPSWTFPLKSKFRGVTSDSFSFLDYDWNNEVEIPIDSHVGSFGIRRRHDVHSGIDLYANVGTPVFAVEDGVVVEIIPFTGEIAGCPWWEDTYGIYVAGKSGIVVYGEIAVDPKLSESYIVRRGEQLGTVLRVLKKDNGRPRSMLHLELHKSSNIHVGQWEIGSTMPDGLLNPTKHLIRSIKFKK